MIVRRGNALSVEAMMCLSLLRLLYGRRKILRLYFGMKAGLWRGGDDVMATDAVFIVSICCLYRAHMTFRTVVLLSVLKMGCLFICHAKTSAERGYMRFLLNIYLCLVF